MDFDTLYLRLHSIYAYMHKVRCYDCVPCFPTILNNHRVDECIMFASNKLEHIIEVE